MINSLKAVQELLKPFEEGEEVLEILKELDSKRYEMLIQMRTEFELIRLDLMKLDGFIHILEIDRRIYRRRLEEKKKNKADYSLERTILDRIEAQLDLLKPKEE